MMTRLREAAKLGFKTAVVPKRLRGGEAYPAGIQVIEARSLREALNQALMQEWSLPEKEPKTSSAPERKGLT